MRVHAGLETAAATVLDARGRQRVAAVVCPGACSAPDSARAGTDEARSRDALGDSQAPPLGQSSATSSRMSSKPLLSTTSGHRVRLVAAVLKRFECQAGPIQVWVLRALLWRHRFEVMDQLGHSLFPIEKTPGPASNLRTWGHFTARRGRRPRRNDKPRNRTGVPRQANRSAPDCVKRNKRA